MNEEEICKTFQKDKISIVPKGDKNPGIAKHFGMQNTVLKLDCENPWDCCLMEIYEPQIVKKKARLERSNKK